jgi:23S rRNA pseudouridine2605 synthase
MRLNRFIARSGVCSRREADEWIVSGRVQVNGAVVTELGTRVAEGDRVVVNGRDVSPRRAEYYLLNKPHDTITTTEDERGRRTVLDLLDVPDERKGALFPVGRLDRGTTGVLLITSDGELAHRLTHPSFEIDKLYRVLTAEDVTPAQLEALVTGVPLDDGPARADRAEYVGLPDRRQIGLSLHEGRNRQVRRMFEALGHRVVDLERVQYAGLTTRGVRSGRWRRLTDREVTRLYKLVKLK